MTERCSIVGCGGRRMQGAGRERVHRAEQCAELEFDEKASE